MTSGLYLSVDLDKFFKTVGHHVAQDIAAGATVVIDFKSSFQGLAKSVLIDNRDGVNVATYRVNSRGAILRTIRAASSRVLDDFPVELIEINAGAGDVVQVSAEVVPLEALQLIKRR